MQSTIIIIIIVVIIVFIFIVSFIIFIIIFPVFVQRWTVCEVLWQFVKYFGVILLDFSRPCVGDEPNIITSILQMEQ